VNVDNVRCLYLGRSGLTEIVFDGEHQVAVKDKMETLCLENAGPALDREGIRALGIKQNSRTILGRKNRPLDDLARPLRLCCEWPGLMISVKERRRTAN